MKYAIEHGGPDPATLGERAQKIQALEKDNGDLRSELKQKEMVIERLQADLQRQRLDPFVADEYAGVREFDRDLIELLKDADRLRADEIVRRLKIDRTDTELMQALDRQLEQLERYGLVASTSQGWRWRG